MKFWLFKQNQWLCLFLISFILSFIPCFQADAKIIDPKAKFLTYKSEHFYIHYPEELAPFAKRLTTIAETHHKRMTQLFGFEPKERTHVVLLDRTDSSNGMATIIPANYMYLYLNPPAPDSSLDNYYDYLEMLFIHEYTHILHIDRYHGILKPFRFLFGKLAAPNGVTPAWMREGIASWQESLDGRGRANSSYSQVLFRTKIYNQNFPHLSQISLGRMKWPAGQAAYIFGVGFIDYLAQKYGEEKVYEYTKRYASSLLGPMLNHQAKKVFGKSFYKLWRDWQKELTQDYSALKEEIQKQGVSPFQPVPSIAQLKKKKQKKQVFHYPKAVGSHVAYQVNSLSRPGWIEIADLNGRIVEKIKRTSSGSFNFSHDSQNRYLAYARKTGLKKHYAFSDVFIYDRKTKKTKRLKLKGHENQPLRASNPDFAPDEDGTTWLVVVRTHHATDNLWLINRKTKEGMPLTQAKPFTQFSNPRFSKDGRFIVASRRLHQKNRDIVLLDRKTKKIKLISDDIANDYQPSFTPNNRAIIYISDATGIPNVHHYDLKTRKTKRLTNVLTGIYQPSFSADGKTLFSQYYGKFGPQVYQIATQDLKNYSTQSFSLYEKNYRKAKNAFANYQDHLKTNNAFTFAENTQIERETKNSESPYFLAKEFQARSKKYHAFPQVLVPRYIIPTFTTLDDAFLVGLAAGRFDPLYRHSWGLYTYYRTDANFLGGGFRYIYNRNNPSFFFGVARYALNWGLIANTSRADFYEQRIEGFAGTSFRFGLHRISLSYFFQDRDNLTDVPLGVTLPTLDHYAGLRFRYTFSTGKKYTYSISPEKGTYLKIGFDVTDSILGSAEANEQQVLTADLRYFLKLPWFEHHVLALRAAGGYAWGDREDLGGAFRFGGPFSEGNFSQLSSRLFAFRGFPGVVFADDRVLLFSAEYRLPLIYHDRGIGTWPIYFRKSHLALFSDFGDSWDEGRKDGRDFFEDFYLSVGGELRADVMVGYGLPLTTRLGYAIMVKNRDALGNLTDNIFGHHIRNGTVYFQLGTSF